MLSTSDFVSPSVMARVKRVCGCKPVDAIISSLSLGLSCSRLRELSSPLVVVSGWDVFSLVGPEILVSANTTFNNSNFRY